MVDMFGDGLEDVTLQEEVYHLGWALQSPKPCALSMHSLEFLFVVLDATWKMLLRPFVTLDPPSRSLTLQNCQSRINSLL